MVTINQGLDSIGFYCTLQYIHSIFYGSGIMATNKTTTLTFRIEPELKEGLRTAATRAHRSIANMVEVLIRDYCAQNGISIRVPDVSDDEQGGGG
jgi:hypothetical protein